jgi:hypothetical protein
LFMDSTHILTFVIRNIGAIIIGYSMSSISVSNFLYGSLFGCGFGISNTGFGSIIGDGDIGYDSIGSFFGFLGLNGFLSSNTSSSRSALFCAFKAFAAASSSSILYYVSMASFSKSISRSFLPSFSCIVLMCPKKSLVGHRTWQ